MAKGLDVGTSFIVLAEEGTKNKVTYKDFRDAFYVIKPTTPIATKMIEKSPTRETKFYMSLTFNQLILLGEKVLVKTLGKDVFHPIKSGWQVRQYDNLISRHDTGEKYEA